MGKPKHKISNWKQYNQALVQRGSLTVWIVSSNGIATPIMDAEVEGLTTATPPSKRP